MKRLVIASDHHGYALKTFLCEQQNIGGSTIAWSDVGCASTTVCDYPPFAHAAVRKLLDGQVHGGVLLCGTGVGMSIAANRIKGVYAALVWSESVARRAKHEDNANILVLPADFIDQSLAVRLVSAWLQESFAGGRYQERLERLDQLMG